MKTYFALALALILAACAAPTESPPVTSLPPATVEQSVSTSPAVPVAIAPTATEITQPVPQATSRGAQLVASDPVIAQVGAGKPVLLEFFRFT